jgi:hypothetical protein
MQSQLLTVTEYLFWKNYTEYSSSLLLQILNFYLQINDLYT